MTSAPNSDHRTSAQSATHGRRASFSPGSTLTELFAGRAPPAPYPGPNANPTQRSRRMSMSGLPAASGQIPSNYSLRRGSVSSVSSSASNLDENAVDDDNGSPTMPTSPFARRMSFGARALRDVRIPGSRVAAQPPGISRENGKGSPPTAPQNGENPHHQRRPSVSTMPLPVSSMSPTAAPAKQTYVDPLQERILKGDFYMD